jgi:E3 ubiquitin-protein ligase RAD18
MKIELVFPHLERCNGQQSPNGLPTPLKPSTSQNGPNKTQNLSPKMERLARLNYSLLKESALRKKLVELGIPAGGSRQQLERRHIEWVTLWNANCDSSKPRKKSVLLSELDVWEKAQGMRAQSLITSPDTGSRVLSKEFDGAGWAAKHDQSFQNLIAMARRGVKKERPELFELKHDAVERSEAKSGEVDAIDLNVDIMKEE